MADDYSSLQVAAVGTGPLKLKFPLRLPSGFVWEDLDSNPHGQRAEAYCEDCGWPVGGLQHVGGGVFRCRDDLMCRRRVRKGWVRSNREHA